MSVEVVTRDDGHLYIIEGNPADGYDVLRINPWPLAHYTRKFEARRAILDDHLEALR